MAWLIGVDEAGYGPNLGPLVIAATVWRTPDSLSGNELYDVLTDVIAVAKSHSRDARLLVADSKQLFTAQKSLAPLERGVHAAAKLLKRNIAAWRSLVAEIGQAGDDRLAPIPWFADFDRELPCDVPQAEIDQIAENLERTFDRTEIRLVDMRAALLFAGEFNQRLTSGNKSRVLSETTLGLVRDLLPTEPGDVFIVCDKHGGRDRYAGLLQETFGDLLFAVREESRKRSCYEWRREQGRGLIEFRQGGEEFLPAALASMTAKYLREMTMEAFNAYWCSHNPELRPTAGYPVDAKRFLKETVELRKQLKIDDDLLWRQK
ncbi:hypothetical protein LOC68_12720 [Blastopirellula sp. JC732]|uniref:Uncharacterized protein n=1 Tax=Blastopirellula sediminis TaxID=2894196 RepID=A0A9X1MMA5_9BACT|nr:hypothetical protein [Blastopirellula sediminis]MCC9607448.1 hypothetical protein [Blastopirellula sediminis]MCC9629259.1 hypothetical protein [Blastopirellula sediminis]